MGVHTEGVKGESPLVASAEAKSPITLAIINKI